MKSVSILLFILALGFATQAQDTLQTLTEPEVMPQFPGGEQELMKYLSKNIRYPVALRENGIEGTVIVSFVVTKTGEIKQIVVFRDIGGGAGEEVARVIKDMPRWIPGTSNGEAVNVYFRLPVTFSLPDEKVKKKRAKKNKRQ